MAVFDRLSGEEVTILAVLIALAAEEVFDSEDLNVLGNFIVAVGSLMLTAAAQDEALKAAKNKAQQADEKKAAKNEAQQADEKKAADQEFVALKDKVEKIAKLVGV